MTRPDGARLFIEEAGPKATQGIVFLHGSALRTDVWHYQLEGIGDRRLVFFDLRGHGRSQPKGDADFSIVTFAEDLEAVIENAGLSETVIVGHSVGGMIALQLCCMRRETLGRSVRGLVLANTTHTPAVETTFGGAAAARLERLARRPFDFIGTHSKSIDRLRKVVRPSDAIFWAVSFTAFGPNPSASQVDYTYDMLAETPADVIFDLIKSYRDFEVTDLLSEITVPALVIGGSNDRLTVPEASRYIAGHLPDAELHILDRCGHMTMLERHREFNRLVEGFAGRVLPAAKPRPRKRTQSTSA